jgi:hypothetical protein
VTKDVTRSGHEAESFRKLGDCGAGSRMSSIRQQIEWVVATATGRQPRAARNPVSGQALDFLPPAAGSEPRR